MRLRKPFILLAIMLFLLSACSNENSQNESTMSQDMEIDNNMSMEDSAAKTEEMAEFNAEEGQSDGAVDNRNQVGTNQTNRMVIYTADVRLKVKKFATAEKDLISRAEKFGGYMVDSNVYRDDHQQLSGSLTFRIPTKKFESFLTEAEEIAVEVLERNVNGQDVTEEYVDLEARLSSKRVVETRLLDFMEKATKTEDLLKISSDLAKVQEEIEQMVGRMKYLENQTDFSTITMYLFEDNVVVPDINKDNLNTLDRTKQQLVKSTNFLLAGVSLLFVFVVGNIPIIIVVSLLLTIVYIFNRKRLTLRKKNIVQVEDENSDNEEKQKE